MDIYVWSTVVLGVWAALGPLVGIRYGQELAKNWQREQWVRENRKQEVRELLVAIFELKADRPKDNQEHEREQQVHQIFQNRVFIAVDLQRLQAEKKLFDATYAVRTSKLDYVAWLQLRDHVAEEVRRLAL